MAFEKVRAILEKAQDIMSELDTHSEQLDELQKAQVIQSLIKAKQAIILELDQTEDVSFMLPKEKQLLNEITQFEESLQRQVSQLNVSKVSVALEHLSEGVNELVKRKQKGQEIVKE